MCDYEADRTGPAETVVLAPSVPAFVAWLLFVGAVVAVGVRRRAPGRLVSGVCILGLFGFVSTYDLGHRSRFGAAVVAVLAAVAEWLAAGAYVVAAALALVVAAAVATVFSRVRTFALPARMEPL